MKKFSATVTAEYTNLNTHEKFETYVTIDDNSRDIAVAAATLQLANMQYSAFEGCVISGYRVSVVEHTDFHKA